MSVGGVESSQGSRETNTFLHIRPLKSLKKRKVKFSRIFFTPGSWQSIAWSAQSDQSAWIYIQYEQEKIIEAK